MILKMTNQSNQMAPGFPLLFRTPSHYLLSPASLAHVSLPKFVCQVVLDTKHLCGFTPAPKVNPLIIAVSLNLINFTIEYHLGTISFSYVNNAYTCFGT